MDVSKEIVIELSENMANVGKSLPFSGHFKPDGDLLPYPEAELVDVYVQFDVTFVNPDVEAEGTITCLVNGYCDKCLAPVTKQIVLPFQQTFYKDCGPEEDDYVYFDSKLEGYGSYFGGMPSMPRT